MWAMTGVSSSPAEEIKEKLDIVEFLKGYLTLQPAGKNFKANCPFHKEKTPSFMVSPERRSWHCFGCGIGGDIFAFVMRYENVEFGEALRILADKAGVELRRINPAEYKYTGLLFELNNLAKEFFRKELENSAAAQEYLKTRKLKPETIAEFELGFAPNQSEALTFHLLKQNYRPEDLVSAGLSIQTERGAKLDRFRGRIMFPIHNHLGKVVGFTGRVLPQFDTGQMGKYVNSPETAIFNKSKLLYGFWRSKDTIRESQKAFLVEGQMDFLMSYQAGVKNAIASSGTALTPDHLRTLRRLADTLIVSFDSDSAGMNAGERAIDLAEASDFQVKVVTFDQYKDPAEMAENDPEGLVKLVASARPAPEFYFEKYLKGQPVDPKNRDFLNRVRAILAKLKAMSSAVERSSWLSELSKRTGIPAEVLQEEAEKLEISKTAGTVPDGTPGSGSETVPAAQAFSRWEKLSQRLLSAMLGGKEFDLGEHKKYLAPGYTAILELLAKGERSAPDPALDGILNLVVLRSEEPSETEFKELKDQLFREYAKERRFTLTRAVKDAEIKGDQAAHDEALSEMAKLPIF